MKKILALCLIFSMTACDDGDLQIEVLDFDESSIQYCETISLDTSVFFKIDDDEVLILNLQSELLKNEVSEGTITSTVPGQSKVTYRIFSDKVSKDYFCSEIPLTEPAVADEIEAGSGEVLITTTLAEDGESYEHKIELSGISLVTKDGSRITDLRINNYGTVITKPSN